MSDPLTLTATGIALPSGPSSLTLPSVTDALATARLKLAPNVALRATAVAPSAGVDAARAKAGAGGVGTGSGWVGVGTGCGELLAVPPPPPPHAASNKAHADSIEIRRNIINHSEEKPNILPVNNY
jgi:hypothetical protein